MRKVGIVFGIIGILFQGTPLSSDPAPSLTTAAEAEKSGDWQVALTSYQNAYNETKDEKLMRNLGSCYAHLGRWQEASDCFESYLKAHPEDSALAGYEAKLKASLAGRNKAAAMAASTAAAEPGVDGVTVFMKDNPRDKQHYQITLENLTPLIFGLDLAYYHDRHNDFGLGWIGYGNSSAGGNLFHPRYRYHRARFYWDSFFELGGLIGGYKEDRSIRGNGDYVGASALGGDFGLGVDYKSEGPWTFNFLLSFNFLSVNSTSRTTNTYGGYSNYYYDYYCGCYTYSYSPSYTRVDTYSYNAFVAYPLIGMSYGFIF